MTIIIFAIILGLLVLVHELGHFLAAKKAGVHVEEFGFGYPPRALKIGRKWGTLFSLNWIPFGGFVKIFGENYESGGHQESFSSESPRVSSSTEVDEARLSSENFPGGRKNFTEVSKKWQATILAGGVVFNILFAWFLFSLGFMIGLPTPVENSFGSEVRDPSLMIVDVLPESPAAEAGLKAGDKIKHVALPDGADLPNPSPESVSDFINRSVGSVSFEIDRGGKILDFELTPVGGLIGDNEDRKIVGINMDMVGTLRLPIHKAVYEGGKATLNITYLTADGLFGLIKDAVQGEADVSTVTGPVGIVGLVGDASRLGFAYLVTFTALISINLAIINLVPFPALDGGRLLFVAVEAVTVRPINAKFAGYANTIGFALLITLMLFVTYRDILKLF